MRKVFVLVALAFMSCEKEEFTPSTCNCGLVLSDDVTDYSVVIRNECSGNAKKFWLQPGDWMNAYVGSNYCITNIDSW